MLLEILREKLEALFLWPSALSCLPGWGVPSRLCSLCRAVPTTWWTATAPPGSGGRQESPFPAPPHNGKQQQALALANGGNSSTLSHTAASPPQPRRPVASSSIPPAIYSSPPPQESMSADSAQACSVVLLDGTVCLTLKMILLRLFPPAWFSMAKLV